MKSKLTLSINDNVIELAKSYAKKRKIKLSKLIESYLHFLTSGNKSDSEEISPLVKSLSRVIYAEKLTENDTSYKKYLIKKYSK